MSGSVSVTPGDLARPGGLDRGGVDHDSGLPPFSIMALQAGLYGASLGGAHGWQRSDVAIVICIMGTAQETEIDVR